MQLDHIAAFSIDDHMGGNPAGVAILDGFPSDKNMLATAAHLGYSETVFAHPTQVGWRVRYFAPELEVPFCGHATIALGAALVKRFGPDTFKLSLNDFDISVEAREVEGATEVSLQSPPTHHRKASIALKEQALNLFDIKTSELDARIPLAIAHAGANHLVIVLKDRERLRRMAYDQAKGKILMDQAGLTTISLVQVENEHLLHVRNPFAAGGVYEDPATGAAAAALAGYLRDLNWAQFNDIGGHLTLLQGEDMGVPSRLKVKITPVTGASVNVGGQARFMRDRD